MQVRGKGAKIFLSIVDRKSKWVKLQERKLRIKSLNLPLLKMVLPTHLHCLESREHRDKFQQKYVRMYLYDLAFLFGMMMFLSVDLNNDVLFFQAVVVSVFDCVMFVKLLYRRLSWLTQFVLKEAHSWAHILFLRDRQMV